MDPNRNRSAVALDALGLVAGAVVMGKPEESPGPGDRLAPAFHADLTRRRSTGCWPIRGTDRGDAARRGEHAVVYDLDAYRRDPAGRAPR